MSLCSFEGRGVLACVDRSFFRRSPLLLSLSRLPGVMGGWGVWVRKGHATGPQPVLTRCLERTSLTSVCWAGRVPADKESRVCCQPGASCFPRGQAGESHHKVSTLQLPHPHPSVTIATPRGDPLLGPAEIQRHSPLWALGTPTKLGGRAATESA